MEELAPARRFTHAAHLLLLVGGITGTAIFFVWCTGSTAFVAGTLLLWSATYSWDARRGARDRVNEAGRRDDRVPTVVVLALAACLLTWSARTEAADDRIWATALKAVVALTAACLAAATVSRIRGDRRGIPFP